MFETGMTYHFDTHGMDSFWKSRDGSTCTIVRPITSQEADIEDVGNMYRVRFNDGVETDAFEDELS